MMLKKLFILKIIFLFTAIIGFCFSEEEITNIELSKYRESYANESIAERLNRLETDFFGMAQSGDLDSRIDMLKHISGNSRQSAIINPRENYYPGQKRSAIRKFWDNVTSTFDTTGTMTGFTPSMTTSGYGYSTNTYGNEFLNFMNGYNNYCPYHNRYHNHNRYIHNPFYNNNNFINSGLNNRYFNNGYNPNRHYYGRHPHRPGHYPHNRIQRSSYWLPPNVSTRSSVQIIRD